LSKINKKSWEVPGNKVFLAFERLYVRLNDSLKLESLTDIEKAGILHWYEITFELGCKTLKDYLQGMGVEVRFPRDTIK